MNSMARLLDCTSTGMVSGWGTTIHGTKVLYRVRPGRGYRPVMLKVAFLIVAVAVAGCSIGPGTVTRDRFDYSEAVAESWKRQMLLNLVKLRYSDAPMFLDVGQIVSGYTVQSSFSAAGSIFNTSAGIIVPGVPNSSIGLGAQGQFTDRPTVTYTPLVGERFARSLMAPIPLAGLMSQIQTGYPVDLVLRLAVNSLGGYRNRFGGDARALRADPEFYELLERLRRIQLSGALGMKLRKIDREEVLVMIFRRKVDPSVETDIVAVRELLGLESGAEEYRVVYGSVAATDKEIAVLSRSMLEVLIDLSSFIVVPEGDVAAGRVSPTTAPEVGPQGPIPPLIRIGSAPGPPSFRPAESFVAVPYRDTWFWIDDRDISSKRLFSFIMFLFTLVETGAKESPPVLTIPTQ